jgi:hypothetical protein
MTISRRSFLNGALSLSVVTVAPSFAAPVPQIYGDGVNDDWSGLQAMFDGQPFEVHGDPGRFIAKSGHVEGGTFLLRRGLYINSKNVTITNCEFIGERDFDGIHFSCETGATVFDFDPMTIRGLSVERQP